MILATKIPVRTLGMKKTKHSSRDLTTRNLTLARIENQSRPKLLEWGRKVWSLSGPNPDREWPQLSWLRGRKTGRVSKHWNLVSRNRREWFKKWMIIALTNFKTRRKLNLARFLCRLVPRWIATLKTPWLSPALGMLWPWARIFSMKTLSIETAS